MFVGSEKKLLEGLKVGAAGCISATTNVTGSLAKKVFDETGDPAKAAQSLMESFENAL